MDIQRDVPKTWDDLTPYQKKIGQALIDKRGAITTENQTALKVGDSTLTFDDSSKILTSPTMNQETVVALFQKLYWIAHRQRGAAINTSTFSMTTTPTTMFTTATPEMNLLSGVPNIDKVVALNKYTDYQDVTVAADGSTTYTQSTLSKGIASKASEMRQKTMQLHDGLKQTDNVYYGDSELVLTTTAYASICFTVIATSLLYVIFVEF